VERRCRPEAIGVVDMLQVLEGAAYVGFIAGAIFAVMELRDMSRDRKLELMQRMNDVWCTPTFEEATIKLMRSDFKTLQEAEEKIPVVMLKLVADYFDHAASLARYGFIDKKLMADVLAYETCYDKMKPWIDGWEELVGYGRYEDFRWMANEERERRLATDKVSPHGKGG